jgi:poly-gamma-glutamate synthesis protein (capsule biosynthesis protein)
MRLLLVVFFLISASGVAQDSKRITLAFMGDVMGHDSQINSARIGESDTYDYNSCFKYIEQDIISADIAIANLEVTLAGPPFKGYPAFSSPDTLVDALTNAGIDGLVMANNHCVDRRRSGLNRTCDVLDKKGIPRTGVFKDSLDRVRHNPMIIEKKGFRLAFLNYTYGTNGILVQPPNIVNHIDTVLMAKDIDVARSQNVDDVIVCVHWGWEYQTSPNPEQKKISDWLQSKGITIIIGSHPHVLQPMQLTGEEGKSNLVAYSMGNFISNQRTAPRDGAAILFVELEKSEEITKVVKAEYQLTWVYTPVEGQKRHFYVLPAKRYKNADWMEETARKRMNDYIVEADGILKSNIRVTERKFDVYLQSIHRREMPTFTIGSSQLVNVDS